MSEDFDPYAARNKKAPTWAACSLLLKASLGSGLLSMPKHFEDVGWATATIAIVVVGVLTLYGLHTLFVGLHILCKQHKRAYIPYGEALYIGFLEGPRYFRWAAWPSCITVNLFMCSFQFISLCAYYHRSCRLIYHLIDEQGLETSDINEYGLYIFPFFLGIYFIKDFKILGILSVVSGILLMLICCIVPYAATKAGVTPKEHVAFNGEEHIPKILFSALFILETTAVVLSIEREMKDPKAFVRITGILISSTVFLVVVYCVVGFMGYWFFGKDTYRVITVNLKFIDKDLFFITTCFELVVFWVSFNVQGHCIIDIIWRDSVRRTVDNKDHHTAYEYLLRTSIVIVTMVFALRIIGEDDDNANLRNTMVEFCGGLNFSTVVIFPLILDMLVRYPNKYGRYKWILVFNMLGMLLGLTFWIYCMNWTLSDKKAK